MSKETVSVTVEKEVYDVGNAVGALTIAIVNAIKAGGGITAESPAIIEAIVSAVPALSELSTLSADFSDSVEASLESLVLGLKLGLGI
jgi:hypothetical protein